MHILQALKEIAQYHDAHVKMMTPWGKKQELLDIIVDEAQEIGRTGYDPDCYEATPFGIKFIGGGQAYEISK